MKEQLEKQIFDKLKQGYSVTTKGKPHSIDDVYSFAAVSTELADELETVSKVLITTGHRADWDKFWSKAIYEYIDESHLVSKHLEWLRANSEEWKS